MKFYYELDLFPSIKLLYRLTKRFRTWFHNSCVSFISCCVAILPQIWWQYTFMAVFQPPQSGIRAGCRVFLWFGSHKTPSRILAEIVVSSEVPSLLWGKAVLSVLLGLLADSVSCSCRTEGLVFLNVVGWSLPSALRGHRWGLLRGAPQYDCLLLHKPQRREQATPAK